MDWYFAEEGQQRGPLSGPDFENLVRAGTIRDETLVWREGMAGWQPYVQVKPGAAPAPAAAVGPTSGGLLCSHCGKSFPTDQVIRYGDSWVCETCKPAFLQRMREGAAPVPDAGPRARVTQEQLLAGDYAVDLGGCLSRAWELFKANAGIIIGASLLVYLVLMAVSLIPYLSVVLSLLLTGPLMGGLWLFYVRKARGEAAGVGDAFGGFGASFGQLMLAGLVSTLLTYLCLAPAGAVVGIGVVAVAAGNREGPFGLGSVAPVLLLIGGLVGFVGLVGMVYLSVGWLFTFPLVADKGLTFWPAMQLSRKMVGKHWWMTFLLAVVCGIVAFAGFFACGVGALVSGPVAFAMLAYHYLHVFGDLAPAA